MLFPEYMEPFEVWRLDTVTSGWGNNSWEYIVTVSGRPESIGKESEVFVHNQSFNDITEVVMLPIQYRRDVQANDHLIDADGIVRKVIGQPEIWKWVMPHVAAMSKRVQWEAPS